MCWIKTTTLICSIDRLKRVSVKLSTKTIDPMFPRSSSSSACLLGQVSEKESAISAFQPMAPLENMVRYVAVANGNTIIAEFAENGNVDLLSMASQCLAIVPPLHSRFSYTTRQRRFICLIEEPLIYCAIMDEALPKADGFAFLQKVRDAFAALLKTLSADLEALAPHSLDDRLIPVMRHIAAPLVGIPQREKNRMEEELQVQQDASGSPSAAAPLLEANDDDSDSQTEEMPSGTRSPSCTRSRDKAKKDKQKVKDEVNEVKDIITENNGEAMDKGKKLEILVDDAGMPSDNAGTMSQNAAGRLWWQNVKLVVILDLLACLVLLVIWLGVCKGTRCLKRSR